MSELKLVSWNINGLRAGIKKGFVEWWEATSPDILGLQEIKAKRTQLPLDVANPSDYHSYWNPAEKKGYSGVAVFSKLKPKAITRKLGEERFDVEGRLLGLKFPGFILYNVYFPNGQRNQERLDYKMAFYEKFLDKMDTLLAKDHKIIVCGDFNTAHQEIDLARPKQNQKRSGFLPKERIWIDKFISHGFRDIFRETHPDEANHYTYWDLRTRARERNVGWRIDYFFVSENIRSHVQKASILSDVMGSDHCPIEITLQL
ncbi:MAG: exodeoxyribonuclease III [Candidatus Hodarchaeales archaeon]|jgi:exodeoxyribonuclease-3